jgi:hypothetical protein
MLPKQQFSTETRAKPAETPLTRTAYREFKNLFFRVYQTLKPIVQDPLDEV